MTGMGILIIIVLLAVQSRKACTQPVYPFSVSVGMAAALPHHEARDCDGVSVLRFKPCGRAAVHSVGGRPHVRLSPEPFVTASRRRRLAASPTAKRWPVA